MYGTPLCKLLEREKSPQMEDSPSGENNPGVPIIVEKMFKYLETEEGKLSPH